MPLVPANEIVILPAMPERVSKATPVVLVKLISYVKREEFLDARR